MTRQPAWMKDFSTVKRPQSSTRYPMSNYLSYDHVTPQYQCYVTKFANPVEPRTFKEATKDDSWITVMKQEIQALKDNQT